MSHTCRDPKGRFVCKGEIKGSGGCKTVYRGYDRVEGREVAWGKVGLQFLNADGLNAALKEAEIMDGIRHPHMVKLLASWVDDKTSSLHLITELYTGSLNSYIKLNGKPLPGIVRKWAKHICSALVYLHLGCSEPIAHRDVKCANVFVNNYTGDVALSDMGYFKHMRSARSASVTGTPEFMAPEVLGGRYGHKVDIYLFGMLLIELATLRKPFSKWRTVSHVYMAILGGSLPDELSQVTNPHLKELILACLRPEKQRPNADELLAMRYFTDDSGDMETVADVIQSPANFGFLKNPIERYCLSRDDESALGSPPRSKA